MTPGLYTPPHNSWRSGRDHRAFSLETAMSYLRTLMTYILPLAITGYVILCGLWIVPDHLFGMYGNIDGKWGAWNARSILDWSSFLNFSPYSPLTGTGTLFLPNLPWLNPGALALGLPTAIEYKYLFSYLIYLVELTVPMYLVFSELEVKKEYAFMAVLLYLSFFFIPYNSISGVPSWYSLGPFYCHQAAAMNLATVALLRALRFGSVCSGVSCLLRACSAHFRPVRSPT